MNDSLKKLRIFAASPSDVASERAKIDTVVDLLKPLAESVGLTLEVMNWSTVVPDAGRPQQIVFDQLKPTSWDIFIGILWHRFGTPPGTKDKAGKDYLSGTEEEFKTAYELWKQHGKPRIVIYRCARAIPINVLDVDQFKRVQEFFTEFEEVKKDNTKGEHPALYQAFSTTEAFEKLLLNNLQKLLIEYGNQSKTPITPEAVQVLTPIIPNNLPRRSAFFGRVKEMEIVMRALSPDDRTWGVLVDGIGGIGKSAIAIEAAYRAQESGLFDAFVFVSAKQNTLEPSGIRELNPAARTLDEFLNETARVLGQPGIAKLTGDDKRHALLDVLRSTRTLLIYDHLETLLKDEQEAIADFLINLPQGCKAIITSRRRAGEGSVWLRVEALDWDAARGIVVNEIARDAELAKKLMHVESRWNELYDETNGSPLALVYILSLMRVRAALSFDSALAMLRGTRHNDDLVNFVYQEARKELTANDKNALGALSLFLPSATFEAWMQVTNIPRSAMETTIDHLNALSLVDVLGSEERYTLHPLTRTFIRNELLDDLIVEREMGTRFARYWIDFARENEGKEDWLEAELENFVSVESWLLKNGLVNDVVVDQDAGLMLIEIANALSPFLMFAEHWDSSIRLNTVAFKVAQKFKDRNSLIVFARNLIWSYRKVGNSTESTIWRDTLTKIEHQIRRSIRVFLSYAREDKDRVRLIYKDLQQAGFIPWMDEKDLKPGQDWELEIEKAIKNSDFALICLSERSTTKQGYVQKEIKIALEVLEMIPEGGVYLIPVRLDDCQVPSRLSKWQWVNVFEKDGFEKIRGAILTEMEKRQK